MGVYTNQREVVQILARKGDDGIRFGRIQDEIAKGSYKLGIKGEKDMEDIDIALRRAVDRGYVKAPSKDKNGNYDEGENYYITDAGKRYLRRKLGVLDEWLNSYHSSNNIIAILALVLAGISLLVSIILPLLINKHYDQSYKKEFIRNEARQ